MALPLNVTIDQQFQMYNMTSRVPVVIDSRIGYHSHPM